MFICKALGGRKALALTLVALCGGIHAFNIPSKPYLGRTSQRIKSFVPTSQVQYRPSSHLTNEHSLQAKSKSIESYTAETLGQTDEVPNNVLGLVGFVLVAFSFVVQKLQIYLNTPCLRDFGSEKNICTQEYHDFAQFFAEHETLSFLLVLTHAIPFALLPWVSKQVSEKGRIIKNDFEEFNPFIMQLAMACIGFGLSLEFGWHVADSWYYDNNFHVLNFGFYFFLISGFALWADGFKNNARIDIVFALILTAATILYPFGNAHQVGVDVPGFLSGFFEDGASVAKIPLYVGMTATFLSITLRGKEIFGKDMYKVAFLSVGVNLAFIFALSGYAYEKNSTYADLSVLNYIFHICHDLLGTEAGVLYFGYLVKNYLPLADRLEQDEAL